MTELFFSQFSSMTCVISCVIQLHIKLLLLQQQTGVGHGSYITPFTSAYQQPPPPAGQQQQQTQQLYIATNYQQSSVPTVLLQPPTNQQVMIIAHMFVKGPETIFSRGIKHKLQHVMVLLLYLPPSEFEILQNLKNVKGILP
jgi:hypothetical protein